MSVTTLEDREIRPYRLRVVAETLFVGGLGRSCGEGEEFTIASRELAVQYHRTGKAVLIEADRFDEAELARPAPPPPARDPFPDVPRFEVRLIKPLFWGSRSYAPGDYVVFPESVIVSLVHLGVTVIPREVELSADARAKLAELSQEKPLGHSRVRRASRGG